LIALIRSVGVSMGLKRKAISQELASRSSSVRQRVVFPVPTSPEMAMKPSPCSMPYSRCPSTSRWVEDRKRYLGSGLSVNGFSSKP
jgi:hypothetical protein